MPHNEPTVHPPEECARRLANISVRMLVELLKTHGYEFTNLKPGSTPWGRGRQFWGMTDDQLAALIRGQTRRHPKPAVEQAKTELARIRPGLIAMGWDGKDRIRPVRRRAKKA
jgi:hypothetical protein